MKLLIAGSRSITDKHLVFELIDAFIYDIDEKPTHIISGMASGVDKIAADYAKSRNIELIEKPADWSIGKHAGFIRNKEMYDIADRVLILWDGKSRGTKHTYELCKKHKRIPYSLYILRHSIEVDEFVDEISAIRTSYDKDKRGHMISIDNNDIPNFIESYLALVKTVIENQIKEEFILEDELFYAPQGQLYF